MPEGTGFLVNSATKHYSYYYPATAEQSRVVLWGTFTSNHAWDVVDEFNQRYGHLFTLSAQTSIIRKLAAFEYSKRYGKLLVSESATLVNELLTAVIQSCEQQYDHRADEYLLSRAIELIIKHENHLYQVSELAQQLDISREHLTRAFKRKLNISA